MKTLAELKAELNELDVPDDTNILLSVNGWEVHIDEVTERHFILQDSQIIITGNSDYDYD